MHDSADGFGSRIEGLRKGRELSQKELGDKVGLSQSSVSRMEADPDLPNDTRILARLAQALEVPLVELIKGFPTPPSLAIGEEEKFYALCPSPLCDSNEAGRSRDGDVYVNWHSGQLYPAEEFDELNFCTRCGTELVKECPSCKRRLRAAGARYCATCGTKVHDRPTKEEVTAIKNHYPIPVEPDDDLPF